MKYNILKKLLLIVPILGIAIPISKADFEISGSAVGKNIGIIHFDYKQLKIHFLVVKVIPLQ